MRKFIFKIDEGDSSKQIEFITDRTIEWTKKQYNSTIFRWLWKRKTNSNK